jgi:hypothetical protein
MVPGNVTVSLYCGLAAATDDVDLDRGTDDGAVVDDEEDEEGVAPPVGDAKNEEIDAAGLGLVGDIGGGDNTGDNCGPFCGVEPVDVTNGAPDTTGADEISLSVLDRFFTDVVVVVVVTTGGGI